ncbi:MAG TPA: EF2563 family selenium-dependent molybdenum hydroxylase system protein [Candidatus Atribacteria bacterium]|nr:EF2563 family selenium-dependent molybdenum hydroxylase system protein [Candidatus Atribacteria bacterium]
MNLDNILIVIRGGGDLATGVAVRLFRAGFPVMILEIERPTVIRLPVSFARAVYEGKAMVEEIEAVLIPSWEKAKDAIKQGKIPVLIDPKGSCIKKLFPTVLVDAILAKRNLGTRKDQAPLVIGLGPGFTAEEDVDVVIETKRGHYLGRVYYQGQAIPDTGVPGEVGGESNRRLLRAPVEGKIVPLHQIGDLIKSGEIIAEVEGVPLKAEISGVLRGLIHSQSKVTKGMKVGDIDPRGIRDYCFTVSDKARSLGGAVLEAICAYLNKK